MLDERYDWGRCYMLKTQITMYARRGRLLLGAARALIRLVFKRERNLAVARAGKIKRQALGIGIGYFRAKRVNGNLNSPVSMW